MAAEIAEMGFRWRRLRCWRLSTAMGDAVSAGCIAGTVPLQKAFPEWAARCCYVSSDPERPRRDMVQALVCEIGRQRVKLVRLPTCQHCANKCMSVIGFAASFAKRRVFATHIWVLCVGGSWCSRTDT